MRIGIVGAGAWGTALAIAAGAQHEVRLWARSVTQREHLRAQRSSDYLPGCVLPAAVHVDDSLETLRATSELLIVATPTAALRPTLAQLVACGSPPPIVWACKGFEQETGALPHQIFEEIIGDRIPAGVLSGPSFALEVARGQPTAVTLASRDAAFAEATARALHLPRFRVYFSTDVVGVEVGGAVKNVMAIATGIADGLQLGLNARAGLITRGLAELTRLGVALGGRPATLMGLAGVGDLVLTCTGDLSRNRRVGLELAQGKTLQQVLSELGHVAEGVHTARAVRAVANKVGVEMPINDAVCAVLDGNATPRDAVEQLLARDPKAE